MKSSEEKEGENTDKLIGKLKMNFNRLVRFILWKKRGALMSIWTKDTS